MTSRLNPTLGGLAAGYMRLIDHFVPEAARNDREAANQARMFLISHSMGPILGNAVPLAVLLFNSSFRLDALVLMIAITCFWVFPFLLKRGVNYDLLVLTSVVNLNFCILWSCYFYGGVSSPTLPWLLIIPILSLFYIGGTRRLQPPLLIISGVSFCLFLAIYNFVPPPATDMPLSAVYGLGIVSTTAALAYVATMAIYYARIFDSGMALEAEVRKREETMVALREAIADADRAGMAKSEFLARMSHELRTPLNAVIGYSELLREDALEQKDKTMLDDAERIHDAGKYLLRLINMILDLAKLESGKIRFNVQTQPISRIIAGAIERHRELIATKRTALTVELDPALTDVPVDGDRLGQVISAMLENATAHTSEGAITVRTRSAGERFEIDVCDTGPGIDPAVLPTLFEAFAGTRDAAGGRFGGTGLSMTLVSRLCTAMGGKIGVVTEPGKGSAFTVTLPMQPPANKAVPTPVVVIPAAPVPVAA